VSAGRSFAELVTVGRVIKPQGRHGELAVLPLSDREDRFPKLQRVFVPGPAGGAREVRVTSTWPHKGRYVVKFEGVDSINDAEAYRGLELRIGAEQLAPLPEGSYYHHQLIGLEVFEGSRSLGRVDKLLEAGAAPVLVVNGPAGETLLPLASDFVRHVDLAGGRLEVTLRGSIEP